MSDESLSRDDKRRLREELVTSMGMPPPTFLTDIGLPATAFPPDGLTEENAWLHVIRQIDAGVPVDFTTLLTEATRIYSQNQVFAELLERCSPDRQSAPGETAEPRSAPAGEQAPDPYGARPNVQAFVQMGGEEERRKILGLLTELGPALRYATNSTMLIEFDTTDPDRVFRVMERIPAEWTVVAPGEPAYLLSRLIVQGPDGRRFRFSDIPASTLISDVTASALSEYPTATGTHTAVADRVLPNGQGERLRPDHSLHEAGVRDGEQLRVASETNAGAVNPTLRVEALTRARNQLIGFADIHGWGLEANAPELATVYEVTFSRPSFGPPASSGGPAIVHDHRVQIEFGPDFPQSAPSVYWLSPIFHPNIYPNYESEPARAQPQLQGYVCLGELEEGYQPGLDLGDLCLVLLDIAGFRNYSLQVPTGEVVRTSGGLVVAGTGNALDVTAATWVRDNQDSLDAVGGRRLGRPVGTPTRRPYRHLVTPLDR
jgi:hypothetical protein